MRFVWLLFVIYFGFSEGIAPGIEKERKPLNSILNYFFTGSNDWELSLQYKGKILTDFIIPNEEVKTFMQHVDKGHLLKGLTFNIYDDKMRHAVVALLELFRIQEIIDFEETVAWAVVNINHRALEYALRLADLYFERFSYMELPPPFMVNPNFFFNSETIRKAKDLKISDGKFNSQDSKVNQFYRTDDVITINTNYSGWNLLSNSCAEDIAYFREDIGLNSYYYGIHLLNPFWMTHERLEELDPKRAEQYYYAHQQLIARYYLEPDYSYQDFMAFNKSSCSYDPYLEYQNGLSFPTRLPFHKKGTDENKAYLATVDTALKECISRGLIIMTNGSRFELNKENYRAFLSKLIRNNIDGVKFGKIIRSIYGANGYPENEYNPAPSVLHHPETAIRDPLYWSLLEQAINYIKMFEEKVKPYDLAEYENKDLEIIEVKLPHIFTYFEYFQTDITNAIGKQSALHPILKFTARQKRLNHHPFDVEIKINSKENKEAVVRIFLGPQIDNVNLAYVFRQYFELDTFRITLSEGENTLNWSPEKSGKFSFDKMLNMEAELNEESKREKYNMYKFPKRLVFPKGTENGHNLTIFVMVTDNTDSFVKNSPSNNNVPYYFGNNVDDKPLGFPFNVPVMTSTLTASNYRFFDVTIFHKKTDVNRSGQFSANLY